MAYSTKYRKKEPKIAQKVVCSRCKYKYPQVRMYFAVASKEVYCPKCFKIVYGIGDLPR